jgi:hypothetical protein
MKRTVYVNNRPLTIDPGDTLGSGGQAVVVQQGGKALKIWHKSDLEMQRKVEYLLSNSFHLPDEVVLPEFAVRDSPGGQMIGFGMSLLPANFRELAVLFNKNLRRRNNIQTPEVLKVFLDGCGVLGRIHKENLVVSDMSGRNVSFVLKPQIKTYWYDVDSYSFANFKCPVWTEYFVDPLILARAQAGRTFEFSRETDWYGFCVSLFWALLFSHPYQGTHKNWHELSEKALNGAWLFDKKIQAPMMAYHPEVLSDELLSFFEEVFTKLKRGNIPTALLKGYADGLVQCSSCDVWYDKARLSCPECRVKSPTPVYKLRLSSLIETDGQLVFTRFQEGRVTTIARERTGLKVCVRERDGGVRKSSLPVAPDVRLDVMKDGLVLVNEPGSTKVEIWDVSADKAKLIETTTSTVFTGNRRSVFRGGGQGLLRLAGKQLLRGKLVNGRLVEKPLPLLSSLNQTWFWADPLGDTVVGLFQIFADKQFWLISNNQRFELDVSSLKSGESLLDISVKFSSQSILVRRLTRRRGKDYFRTDWFNLTGVLLESRCELVRKHSGSMIHGCAYDHGVLWIPSDEGILKEEVKSGKVEKVLNTKGVVSSGDGLVYLGRGNHFLVLRDKKIEYLVF